MSELYNISVLICVVYHGLCYDLYYLQRKTSSKSQIYKLRNPKFILKHQVKNPLPRGGNIVILPPLEAAPESAFTEEEDELAIYLAQTFSELRSLKRKDLASLIRDTIKFVINKTTKAIPGKNNLSICD